MKNKYLITLAIIFAGVLLFSTDTQAQRLFSGGKPKVAVVKGFDEAFCVQLSGNFKICRVTDAERENPKFVILKRNEILTTIASSYYRSACCEAEDFFAFRGDLDKNGSPEIVIASKESMSNGLGIVSYDVHIFRDPVKFPNEKPFSFSIEEFGEKGNFIFDKRKNETQILVTYWSGFDNLDKKRSSGTYLVGKWFRYRNGLLNPIIEKPTLARRLLYSFGDEIGKTQNNPHAPLIWLRSKNTHKLFAEPKDAARLIGEQFGVVKNYQANKSKHERFLSIELNSGETLEADLSYSAYGSRQGDRIPVTDLGLWKNRFVLPFRFDPVSIVGSFEGRKIRLETYQDRYFNRYAKLWILEK